MSTPSHQSIIEALIFAADAPLSVGKLHHLLEKTISQDDIRLHLEAISEEYSARSVELKQVGSGYRFQVRDGFSPYLQALWSEKPPKYSRALLETLALIAYRQPITRAEIEDVRGVAVSSYIMRTLQEREWVKVIGHREIPGRPALYATTSNFLDYFNLENLSALPLLPEPAGTDLPAVECLHASIEETATEWVN